jgi:hypothetical protein
MSSTVPRPVDESRSTRVDLAESGQSTSVDQTVDILRASATTLGWTLDALAAHVGKDRAYIGRVLAGDKPCTTTFLDALPDDLQSLFYSRQAERRGHVVVPPLDHETARRYVVSGLCALLEPLGLPAKAGPPLKVSLGAPARSERRKAR